VPARSDFASIAARPGAGCLAVFDAPRQPAVPRYGASLDRAAVEAFLAGARSSPGTPAPGELARLTIERFHCTGCHQRDGRGGLDAELLARLLITQQAEAAEAVVPPPLTAVTDRLLAPHLRRVLEEDARVRPWMGLKMPHFGREHLAQLPAGLAALDAAPLAEEPHSPPPDAALSEAGRTLVGNRGFGCIKCHDLLGVASRGTRGPELSTAPQRVRFDWYQRWMTDPQRLQPGTRMPTVFLEGRSPHQQVLGGDPQQQQLALWQYLLSARGLPPPEGLDGGPAELARDDRPLVFRTFLVGTTPRAMAIRYPNGVHLAYDAQMCRLAYGWTGEFIDTNPVWEGRGGNRASPKGPIFWTAPAAFPWAVTAADAEAPDYTGRETDTALGAELPDDGQTHPTRLHFRGYRVAERGPTFRYELELASGERAKFAETVESLASDAGFGARRTCEVHAPAGSAVWLRVAVADATPLVRVDGKWVPSDGASLAGDAPLLVSQQGGSIVARLAEASAGASWQIAPAAGGTALLVRVPADGEGIARVAVEVWSPRNPVETEAMESLVRQLEAR
jgi:hypothetical protein